MRTSRTARTLLSAMVEHGIAVGHEVSRLETTLDASITADERSRRVNELCTLAEEVVELARLHRTFKETWGAAIAAEEAAPAHAETPPSEAALFRGFRARMATILHRLEAGDSSDEVVQLMLALDADVISLSLARVAARGTRQPS
jgi:hypothetical protein